MKGDKLVFWAEHEDKARYLLQKILDIYKMGSKQVVLIGGQSGTGKTEIARLLQVKLFYKARLRSKVIHIDDYYNTHWEDRDIVREKTSIIGMKEINFNKLEDIIDDFKLKSSILHLQQIHKFINAIEYTLVESRHIDVLLIEGLYACALNGDYTVHLDGSMEDTYKFRKERMKEDPDDDFRKKVLEIERGEVKRLSARADLIIPFTL